MSKPLEGTLRAKLVNAKGLIKATGSKADPSPLVRIRVIHATQDPKKPDISQVKVVKLKTLVDLSTVGPTRE